MSPQIVYKPKATNNAALGLMEGLQALGQGLAGAGQGIGQRQRFEEAWRRADEEVRREEEREGKQDERYDYERGLRDEDRRRVQGERQAIQDYNASQAAQYAPRQSGGSRVTGGIARGVGAGIGGLLGMGAGDPARGAQAGAALFGAPFEGAEEARLAAFSERVRRMPPDLGRMAIEDYKQEASARAVSEAVVPWRRTIQNAMRTGALPEAIGSTFLQTLTPEFARAMPEEALDAMGRAEKYIADAEENMAAFEAQADTWAIADQGLQAQFQQALPAIQAGLKTKGNLLDAFTQYRILQKQWATLKPEQQNERVKDIGAMLQPAQDEDPMQAFVQGQAKDMVGALLSKGHLDAEGEPVRAPYTLPEAIREVAGRMFPQEQRMLPPAPDGDQGGFVSPFMPGPGAGPAAVPQTQPMAPQAMPETGSVDTVPRGTPAFNPEPSRAALFGGPMAPGKAGAVPGAKPGRKAKKAIDKAARPIRSRTEYLGEVGDLETEARALAQSLGTDYDATTDEGRAALLEQAKKRMAGRSGPSATTPQKMYAEVARVILLDLPEEEAEKRIGLDLQSLTPADWDEINRMVQQLRGGTVQ